MLRKIRVYGSLAKFLGQRVFEADIASAAEAVRFLVANFPQLEKHMAEQHYRVDVGNYGLTLDELHHPTGQQEIKIVPVIGGAGGDVGRILIGAALIAGAFFTGGATIGLLGLAAPIAVSTVLATVGISLVLGGVAGLLTPTPELTLGRDGDNDPRKSYSFSGIQNTSRQGVPVPIVYGETLVGSVVISAGIDTVAA
jgi:predicted phage tail protein